MTYAEWVRALLREHRAACGHRQRCTGCWACDTLDVSETDRVRCHDLSRGAPGTVGGFDGHHVLPKQLLKNRVDWPIGIPTVVVPDDEPAPPLSMTVYTLRDVLVDLRVGVPLRRWHHDQWEARRLSVPRWMLPAGVEEIAVELGLDWWLDRTFGEAVARVR